MAMKSHISNLRKQTGSKELHQTTGVLPNKKLIFNQTFERGSRRFFQTEPHEIDQVISQESYIVRRMFHNGPILKFRLSWKYHQGRKEDDSAGKCCYLIGYTQEYSSRI